LRKIYGHEKIKGNNFASTLVLQSARNRIMQNGGKFLNNFGSNKSCITKKNEYSRHNFNLMFHVDARSIES